MEILTYVCVVALALQSLGSLAVLALVLRWYAKQWGKAAEFTSRCQDRADEAQKKAIADAIASGTQPANLASPGAERVSAPSALRRALAESDADLENVNG